MAGLFTLDSADLGVLDADVLGGPGTGFIVGSSTSTGTATGVQGFTGSASGAQSSAGAVAGSPALTGTASGSTTSAGTVVGTEGAQGVVTGTSVTAGSAAGSAARFGSAAGANVNGGAVAGTPSLSGNASGSTVSAGTVIGTKPTPPPPPPPPAPVEVVTGGGPRLFYPVRRPLQPEPQVQPTHLVGAVVARSYSTGSARGSIVLAVRISATQSGSGVALGVRWPDDFEIARRKRVRLDEELLLLEI
jgi:hypothetical protein